MEETLGSYLLDRDAIAEETRRRDLAATIERLPRGPRPHPILAALSSGAVCLRQSAGEVLVRAGLRLQDTHRIDARGAVPAVDALGADR